MGLVAVTLGGVPLYVYGLVVSGAVLLGILAAWVNVRTYGEEFWRVEELLLWGLPLSLAGGRLAYVFRHWGEFSTAPLSVFCIWQGGFSFLGAGLVGFFVVFAYSQIHGFDGWQWMDILMPAFLLAAAASDLGSLFLLGTGEALSTNLPEGHFMMEYVGFQFFSLGFREAEYLGKAALYQAGLQFLVFLAVVIIGVWQRQRRLPWAHGCVALLGMGLMAVIQFGCAFWGWFFWQGNIFSAEHIFFAGMAILCFGVFFCRLRQKEQNLYR
ncbi:MAG: prolipoprotein diacylglyceryl transferase [Selenomonadaceae bacterium]|nr:prolipoprotein diacylglyceryl transferase [Selenomonadaceae bacterium]